MKKSIVISIVALIAPCFSLSAQSPAFDDLRLTGDPVAYSMGGATLSARNSSAWTTDGNAALLPLSSITGDASLTYQNTNAYGSIVNLGVSYKFGRLALVAGGSYGNYKERITSYTTSGGLGDSFRPNNMKFGLGAGYALSKSFSVGATCQYLSDKYASDVSYNGISAAVYAALKLGDFKLGAGVKNLGSQIEDISGEKYSQASAVNVGGLWSHDFGKHNLTADVEMEKCFKDGIASLAGVCYTYDGILSLRGGYHFGDGAYAQPSFASIGAGLTIGGLYIDFAYLLANDTLKGTTLVGIGLKF